jgi:hypothetical protein
MVVQVVQRLLDRLELARAIRGHDNLRPNVSHKKAQKAQKSKQPS